MSMGKDITGFTQIEESNCTIYCFSDELGSSTKIYYPIFPGVFLVHLNVQRPYLIMNLEASESDFIEIGYCKEGCMELRDSHSKMVMVPGDITVHCRVPLHGEIYFPLNHYQALSILIDLKKAPQEALEMLERFEVDLGKMIIKYRLHEQDVYILKQATQIARLFEEMYTDAGIVDIGYQRIRLLEVFLRIRDFCPKTDKINRRPISSTQEKVAKEAYRYLTLHPEECHTLDSLAQMFSVSKTQLKEGFRSVYGQPIHAFASEIKMRAAAETLLKTDMKVIDVASQFGYYNPSKFSTAFQKIMGKTPKKYRTQQKELKKE